MGRIRNWAINRSRKFFAPAIVGLRSDKSNALAVGPGQIQEANEFAQSIGCGSPFGADGKPVMDRVTKKRYLHELNKRRVDMGEPRMVNFDGGYGDET